MMKRMRMDQIAFYCTSKSAEREVKEQFGLTTAEWIKDTVYAHCIVRGRKCDNVAELQFNYDLGVEFEIIRYIEGDHWLASLINSKPFIGHIGVHLDDNEPWPVINDWRLVQVAETYKHTAEHLTHGYAAGRLYSYRIYEMSEHSYIKFIKRRQPNDNRQ